MRTGVAHLPLHRGRAPAWLFKRMSALAREIVVFMTAEFGPDEVLRRLSDPFWFQALGCVLGFDWHSSGVTTTTCGALKEGLKAAGDDAGVIVCGGKGATSRKTPQEVEQQCDALGLDAEPLVYASRLAAKTDNAAVQDGFQIYHHTFFFTRSGRWAVVQQGLNDATGYARRYHWLSDELESFVCEPHAAVCCDERVDALNLVARENEAVRRASAEAAQLHPDRLLREMQAIARDRDAQLRLFDEPAPAARRRLDLPARHDIRPEDLNSKRLRDALTLAYEAQPQDFEQLLGVAGVGPKTLRALSLVAELAYGAAVSFRDPARFSFAHGGKDGIPYPVDRETYDKTIEVFRRALNRAGVDRSDKAAAFKRLRRFERLGARS